METMKFSSRATQSILELLKTRRSLSLIGVGILFVTLVCTLDNLLGASSTLLSFFLALPLKVIFIGAAFSLAFLIHRLAWHIAGALLYSSLWSRLFLWSSNRLNSSRLKLEVAEVKLRVERQQTIQQLVASAISVTAFVLAALLSLGQFLSAESLALFTGLFTAAFSLGARPLIADMFTGIGFIFTDNFDVGEKIELGTALGKVEGVVEGMTLQTTLIRAPGGELYMIPNSDIRVLRNFSRGSYSTAHIKLKIATADLEQALAVLSELGNEVSALLPELLESWRIISETGVIGNHTELTLLTRTNFGQAAEVRPRLLTLVQKRLVETGITLID